MNSIELAHAFAAPLIADVVAPPLVSYEEGVAYINFQTRGSGWGRISFEKLDSIRVSRGEYDPYPAAPGEEQIFSWVSTISNSQWLRQRYDYEKRYYGTSYEFGGNVDEMLTDFTHYVFSFHDQYVEVLSRGLWFESSDRYLGSVEPTSNHPFLGLPKSSISERFEAHGIACQVRRNPLAMDKLECDAKYCSQTILEIATELDGNVSVNWRLSMRVLNGISKIHLRNYFGHTIEHFNIVPSLADIRPQVNKWLSEVHQRRKKMGKA